MTHPTEAAAERLRRRVKGESYRDVYLDSPDLKSQLIDQDAVITAYLRETDPRPIDEEFARSVAVEEDRSGIGFSDDMELRRLTVFYFGHAKVLHLIGSNDHGWTLHYGEQFVCNACTIGQFWTACRLFGVQVKAPQ